MKDLNATQLVGRLTRDVEVGYTPSGTPAANFAVAVNSSRKEGDKWVDEPNFFDCALYGNIVESLRNYLTKGKQVGIIGELRQEKWVDKETGGNRSRVRVLVNHIQLLGSKNDSEQSARQPKPTAVGASSSTDYDDDIPI